MQRSLKDSSRGPLLTRPATSPLRSAHLRGATIAALATSDSETVYSQPQVLQRLGLEGNEFAQGIFERCGVQRRHLELDDDFLAQTLQGRTAQVEHSLLHHATRAIDALGVDPADIGTIVSSSLYSLGCPTLAHRLVEHYEMDPATDKYHLSGVGCASAVPLMRLASGALREHPGKHALVVAAESMSGLLTRSRPGDPKAKVVGAALFGDGCAAALLAANPEAPGPTIVASQVHQIPGTLDAVSLHASTEDSHLHLARELPDVAGEELRALVDGFLRHRHLRDSDIDHWLVHPGGRRIIENVQDALELSPSEVAVSWDALREHGNVGTPSILYVLEESIARRRPKPGEHGLMVTIGPGVTVGLMLLGW